MTTLHIDVETFSPTPMPCRWCGKPTPMLGTEECDPCHEVRIRVCSNPVLAALLLSRMGVPTARETTFRRQLECVRDNLRIGMGKGMQKLQARSIDEVLNES